MAYALLFSLFSGAITLYLFLFSCILCLAICLVGLLGLSVGLGVGLDQTELYFGDLLGIALLIDGVPLNLDNLPRCDFLLESGNSIPEWSV